MHKDMHYAGTYAMAKLAGLPDEASLKIATSAQFVDDAKAEIAIIDEDSNEMFASEISTRYSDPLKIKDFKDFKGVLKDYLANLRNYIDQLNIWVPFHFLPGDRGNTLTQKLICRINSKIAREMFDEHIEKACLLNKGDSKWGHHLIGVAAHVYADTFAHYGFSGISSRINLVEQSSIKDTGSNLFVDWIKKVGECRKNWIYKVPNIKDMLLLGIAEKAFEKDGEGAMGHVGVGEMPDHPFLSYSFKYEKSNLYPGEESVSERDNKKTYLDACENLHKYFKKYLDKSDEKTDEVTQRDFSEVSKNIKEILKEPETDSKKRLKIWQKKAKEFWGINIPNYSGKKWPKNFAGLKNRAKILECDAYCFYMAAAWHKRIILDKILPAHGINIECRQFRVDSGGFAD